MEDELGWVDLAGITNAVETILDPMLAALAATWRPDGWVWR